MAIRTAIEYKLKRMGFPGKNGGWKNILHTFYHPMSMPI